MSSIVPEDTISVVGSNREVHPNFSFKSNRNPEPLARSESIESISEVSVKEQEEFKSRKKMNSEIDKACLKKCMKWSACFCILLVIITIVIVVVVTGCKQVLKEEANRLSG